MRPYSAEANRCDAKVGGNEFERHSFEDVRRSLQQVAVSFLCTVKLQAFNAIDCFNISCLKDFSEQTLYVWKGIVEPKQLRGIDGYDFRCFQHLYSLSGRLAAEKALHPRNNLIFKRKALRDIIVVFEIIDTRHAPVDKVDSPASVSNRLQVAAFLDGVRSADDLNGCLCSA